MFTLNTLLTEYAQLNFSKINLIRLILKRRSLDMNSSIYNDTYPLKIYDKRNIFESDFLNFPLLDDNVPRSTSYCV